MTGEAISLVPKTNIPTEVPADIISRINSEYAVVAASLAARDEAKDSVKVAEINILSHATRCGEALNDAKAIIEHGKWSNWLKANCPKIHQTTANDYMRIAAHPDEIKGALSIRAALKLLPATKSRKPKTPKGGMVEPDPEPQPEETLSNLAPDEVFKMLRTKWTSKDLDELGKLIADHLEKQEAREHELA